ncbi:hexosaminidase D-like isoform X2 [Narcine bancroftii]
MLRINALNFLRFLVFLVVILVPLKIYSKSKTTQSHTPKSINFLRTNGNSLGGKYQVMNSAKEAIQQEKVRTKPAAKARLDQPKDHRSSGMRVVHLDLKGAQPKLSYLKQIFPLLASIGVHGILLEYEDTFPYSEDLEILKSTSAFSSADISTIQQLAASNNLEIIPLIQTFGHMEFVLKHNKYWHLREAERYPNSLNPHLPESLNLVKEILTQILAKHQKSTWLHIGGDEVYHLGESTESRHWLKEGRGDIGQMFLKYIKEVGSFVVNNYPGLKLLMWDDMLRKINNKKIHECGIADYITPMMWFYQPKFDIAKAEDLLAKYVDNGFRTIWFASAFKGATGVNQIRTPIKTHLENHLQWLQVIQSLSKFPSLHFQGLALTGWQRYDHFSTLCELLPVAIPSLVVCMQAVTFGSFTNETKAKAEEILGFKDIDLEDNFSEGNGTFAGVEIYHMIDWIYQNLEYEVTDILENYRIKGWFSHYHRKHRFANPWNMERFGNKIIQLHTQWEEYLGKFREQMEKIYFPDTVEEWVEVYVNPYMDPLREIVKDYKEIITLMAAPKQ